MNNLPPAFNIPDFSNINGGIPGYGSEMGMGAPAPTFGMPVPGQLPIMGAPTGMGMEFDHVSMSLTEGAIPRLAGDHHAASTLKIRKVLLGATKPQQKQFRRNYDVVMDGQTLSGIQNAVDRNGGLGAVTTGLMSSLLADPNISNGGVVRYSATPEGQVGIDNEWDTQRFRFVIIADVYRNGQLRKTEVISGYTDSMAIINAAMENSRQINPQMMFMINNITTVMPRIHHSTAGTKMMQGIAGSSAVLRNDGWANSLMSNQLWSMRPEDVNRTTDKLTLIEGLQGDQNYHGSFPDLDTSLAGLPKLSSRASDMPATYASRTIQQLVASTMHASDLAMSDDYRGRAGAAGAAAAERSTDEIYTNVGFVLAMESNVGCGVRTTSVFSYQDLMALDPTIDSRVTVATQAYESSDSAIHVPRGTACDTTGQINELALGATLVGNVLMSLMSHCGVSLIAMDVGNDFGKSEVVVSAMNGMDSDGNLWRRVEELKQRLKVEALAILSRNDERQYHLDIFADMYNDIFIRIRLDNDYGEYVIPAFASSLMSPVVTNDQEKLVGLANSVKDVADYCVQAFTQPIDHVPGSANSMLPGLDNY